MLDYLDYFFLKIGNYDANIDFIIVGNKSDLDHPSESEIIELWQSHARVKTHKCEHLKPLIVSAKNGENIGQIMEAMSRTVIIEEMAEKPLALEEQPIPEEKGCRC